MKETNLNSKRSVYRSPGHHYAQLTLVCLLGLSFSVFGTWLLGQQERRAIYLDLKGKIEAGSPNSDLIWIRRRTHLGTEPGRYNVITVSDSGCGMSKEKIQRIFEPDLPIVMSTGYSIDDVGQLVEGASGIGFIQKPFQMSQLAEMVANTLAARTSKAIGLPGLERSF